MTIEHVAGPSAVRRGNPLVPGWSKWLDVRYSRMVARFNVRSTHVYAAVSFMPVGVVKETQKRRGCPTCEFKIHSLRYHGHCRETVADYGTETS